MFEQAAQMKLFYTTIMWYLTFLNYLIIKLYDLFVIIT